MWRIGEMFGLVLLMLVAGTGAESAELGTTGAHNLTMPASAEILIGLVARDAEFRAIAGWAFAAQSHRLLSYRPPGAAVADPPMPEFAHLPLERTDFQPAGERRAVERIVADLPDLVERTRTRIAIRQRMELIERNADFRSDNLG